MKDKETIPDEKKPGMLVYIREDLYYKEIEKANSFWRCSYTDFCKKGVALIRRRFVEARCRAVKKTTF